MSCTGCSSKFGLLTREHSCPNCQFSYCAKCLKSSVLVPKLGKERKVCKTCFEALSRATAGKSEQREPPAALQKRMDALNRKSEARDAVPSLGGNSAPQVEEIENRLKKLRQDSKDVIPIHADIEDRLAKLKEVDVSYYRQPPITVYTNVRKTDGEKASDLFAQVMHEVAIDRRRAQVIKATTDEMERRLERLRDLNKESVDSDSQGIKEEASTDAGEPGSALRQPAEPSESAQEESKTKDEPPIDEVARLIGQELKVAAEEAKKGLQELQKDKDLMKELGQIKAKKQGKKELAERDDSDDDSTEADAVVTQVLEEARLEEQEELEELGLDSSDEEVENARWCVICDRDAVLCCLGCSRDGYCLSCYKEGHKSEPHKTVPLKK